MGGSVTLQNLGFVVFVVLRFQLECWLLVFTCNHTFIKYGHIKQETEKGSQGKKRTSAEAARPPNQAALGPRAGTGLVSAGWGVGERDRETG